MNQPQPCLNAETLIAANAISHANHVYLALQKCFDRCLICEIRDVMVGSIGLGICGIYAMQRRRCGYKVVEFDMM